MYFASQFVLLVLYVLHKLTLDSFRSSNSAIPFQHYRFISLVLHVTCKGRLRLFPLLLFRETSSTIHLPRNSGSDQGEHPSAYFRCRIGDPNLLTTRSSRRGRRQRAAVKIKTQTLASRPAAPRHLPLPDNPMRSFHPPRSAWCSVSLPGGWSPFQGLTRKRLPESHLSNVLKR